jgi:hypothetical protein
MNAARTRATDRTHDKASNRSRCSSQELHPPRTVAAASHRRPKVCSLVASSKRRPKVARQIRLQAARGARGRCVRERTHDRRWIDKAAAGSAICRDVPWKALCVTSI